jgi:hypothetical protein
MLKTTSMNFSFHHILIAFQPCEDIFAQHIKLNIYLGAFTNETENRLLYK